VGKKTIKSKKTVKKRAEKAKKTLQKPLQNPSEDPVLREILLRIAGEHGYGVAKTLFGGEITDEEVAKRIGIRVNLVRRILYELYENRVVSYRRVRDEHSGWYIYYWQIEPERAREYFNDNKRLLLQKLEDRLDVERNTMFFGCDNGCPKLPFDLAAESDFKCQRCGEKMGTYDNSNVITALERQIESLREHLVGG
jgi:transcription initiation factor TFIIE subunit alpha